MTRETFLQVVEKYLADVLHESVRLFDTGVAHDRCISIATQVVDARDIKRARMAQDLLVDARATLPAKRN